MNAIKLCLLVALHFTLVAKPLLAQEPAPALVMPPLRITAQAPRCHVRPLLQGSGSVRICEAR
jgi:hypothetical protein